MLPKLGQKSVDDVLAAVGRGEMSINDVLRAVAPDAVIDAAPATAYRPQARHDHGAGQEGWFNLAKVMNLKFRVAGNAPAKSIAADGAGVANGQRDPARSGGVPIRGVRGDLPVSFETGGAVPGDRIVGVLIPGEGIRVFQIHSPRLAAFEQASWIDVTWDIDPDRPQRFPARLAVTALNEPGTLAQIAQVIGEADGNIDNLRMRHRAADFTEMLVEVEVFDLGHLNRIIAGLKAKQVVSKVERSFE